IQLRLAASPQQLGKQPISVLPGIQLVVVLREAKHRHSAVHWEGQLDRMVVRGSKTGIEPDGFEERGQRLLLRQSEPLADMIGGFTELELDLGVIGVPSQGHAERRNPSPQLRESSIVEEDGPWSLRRGEGVGENQ